MPIRVTGIDHIYLTVADLERSTAFYDELMRLLGFRKGTGTVGGQPHVHYFNQSLQYTLRPARADAAGHDALVPGLHHLCFQVEDAETVNAIARGLQMLEIECSEPAIYPEYGEDYYAIYLKDPDGIELELVSRTRLRDLIRDHWESLDHFENPLSKAGLI